MDTNGHHKTPTRLTVSDAAKAAGIGRSTINKHIAEGKLSKGRDEKGHVYVDASELVRVYPDVDMRRLSETAANRQQETPQKPAIDTELQAEVVALRERLAAANLRLERETRLMSDTIDDLRRRLDLEAEERRKLTMMLTDQRTAPASMAVVPPPVVQERVSWWGRLFGKGKA